MPKKNREVPDPNMQRADDKGKDKGAKGKGKNGQNDDGGKGGPGPGAPPGGAPGAQEPNKKKKEFVKLEDRPPGFFTAMQDDGYQRGLCLTHCLDGKCKFGDQCVMSKHGGHPQLPIPDDMKRALTKRREKANAWLEKKKKFNRGGKGGKSDAELKRQLDGDNP